MSNNYHHHHHNHQSQPPPLPPSLQQQQMNEPPHPYSHNQGNSIQAIHNINQQNSYPIHHQQSFLPNHQSQQLNQHYLGQSPPLPAPPPLPHTFTVPQGVPPQSQSQFQNQNSQGPNFPLPPPQAIVTNIKDIPQNVNTFITTTTTKKSTTPLQTPKKKRGRPPKPDSLAQKITTTLNININASPPNSNPAESNSNSMVKRGAPDAFTPLMRVSPTHPPKRRRKSSVGTTTSGSPTAKRSKSTKKSNKTTTNDTPHLVTPLSSSSDGHFPSSEHSYQFDYKTLDKLSMVTQSQGYYNTPPPTSTNASFSTPNQRRHSSGLPTPREQLNNNSKIYSSESSQLSKINECKQESTSPSKNLLPPVSLTSNSNNNTHPLDKLKGSPIKINREKPTSPIEIVPKSNNINSTTTTTNTNTTVDSIKSRKQSLSSSSAEEFSFKLTIDDSGKAVLSGDMFAPTKLSMEQVPSHPRSPKKSSPIQNSPSSKQVIDTPSTLVQSNSVIGIETLHTEPKVKAPLRRHNSDITNFTSSARDSLPILSSINEAAIQSNNPQTPKDTYTYASTGLTPLFNLTPQFNALMYSVMNLNGSPSPFKRANNPFLVNQEIFTGCGVNESNSQQQQQQQSNTSSSLSSESQQLEELVEQPHLEDHQSDLSSELLTSKDTTATDIIQQNYSSTSSSSSLDESGDARLALKKIIHVKRQ